MKAKKNVDAGYKQVRDQLLAGDNAAERGRIDGVRNLPPNSTTQPSDFEAQIVERARSAAATAIEKCQGDVAEHLEAWRSKAAPDPTRKIDDARREHDADLDASAANGKIGLGRIAETLRLARRQTEAVIGATDVQPPARGWSNASDFVFLFIVMFGAETYIASLLLQDALGMFNSVIMAAVFTAGSVALGAAAGVGALRKRKGSKPGPLEILRRWLTPASVVTMAGFHIFLAHWRALGLEARPLSDLPQRFLESPFGPALHYETWILAILAAVVFGSFAFKSFDFWGGAIDLRKVDRARIKAEDAWEDGKREYQDAVVEAGDDAREDIQAAVDEAGAWQRSAATFSDEMLGIVFSSNRLIECTRDAVESISAEYRAANASCRDDGGPTLWASPMRLELRDVPTPEAVRAIAERFAQLAEETKERAQEAVVAVRQREKEAIESLDAFFAAAAQNNTHVDPFKPDGRPS